MSRLLSFERSEERTLLSSVPFGATPDDTAEYMLGEVLVSVVLLESDGSIDANSEDWTPTQISAVKQSVREGLDWWVELLDRQNSVHSLEFEIDFTYADHPIQTGYEPISRKSEDFALWIDDFFAEVSIDSSGSFSEGIRAFNHGQRLKYDMNWAFTIFVVNSAQDEDQRFDLAGEFSQSFAFAGGRFFVMTSERPASSVAHETGHIFWAMDEYEGSRSYSDRRGYYNTQNLNAADGHPNPAQRVRSIMDQQSVGYSRFALSPSAMEMIGWKDSDGDGIFDVLDVPLKLSAQFSMNNQNQVVVTGNASVQTLPNQNPAGTGNAMTLNRVARIEYRFDGGDWFTGRSFGAYEVDFELIIDKLAEAELIEVRAVDAATNVTSATLRWSIDQPPIVSWTNPINARDVNNDGSISPIDALLIINDLNRNGSRRLPTQTGGPPFIDVNGDGLVAAIDALLVINRLNENPPATTAIGADHQEDRREGDLDSFLTDLAFALEGMSSRHSRPVREISAANSSSRASVSGLT